MQTVAEEQATQRQHGLSAVATPANAGLFHARLDDGLSGGLNRVAANG